MLILPGSNALSSFRTQGLLTQLQEIDPAIVGVSGRFLHFVDAATELAADDLSRLGALLTYGDPFGGEADGDEFVVIPRFGTISPWASKATDIAHNCGMAQIKRIERGICARRAPTRQSRIACGRPMRPAARAAVRWMSRARPKRAWPERVVCGDESWTP